MRGTDHTQEAGRVRQRGVTTVLVKALWESDDVQVAGTIRLEEQEGGARRVVIFFYPPPGQPGPVERVERVPPDASELSRIIHVLNDIPVSGRRRSAPVFPVHSKNPVRFL